MGKHRFDNGVGLSYFDRTFSQVTIFQRYFPRRLHQKNSRIAKTTIALGTVILSLVTSFIPDIDLSGINLGR